MGLTSAAGAPGSGESLYRFAPVASWVKPVAAEYDAPLPSGGVQNGKWHLLFDRQINVTAEGDDHYLHSAVKVTSSSGVDSLSQVDITVDPTRQSLDIHSIRVVRAGRIMEQRREARITALPAETELRNRIYNGRYNINVLLSDVRSGDVVEYEYTIHSRERIFPGHFSEGFSIARSGPVRWQRIRIVSPTIRALHYRVSDRRRMPVLTDHGATREFVWEWHDLAGIVADNDRPNWYVTWPYLEVSDLGNWSEVVRRVVPLFSVRPPMSPELAEVVSNIRGAGGTPAEQALRALQFVQEEIRYVSISIGRGAYQPASPATVLSRRFGDCKDKSLLLATILRALGVDAQPALVNTWFGRTLDESLPTPYLFDHAIVRMQIGSDVYWLDGTAEKQFSPLSPDSPADFEQALVVDGSTTGLARIPRPATGVHGKKSEVLIDLRKGRGKPAKLQITTSYTGTLADATRADFADRSPEQRQSDYINYIVRYYPGAKTSQPITIEDDESKNVIQVREYYDLDQTYTKNESGDLEFFLEVDEIYRYVNKLSSSVRKAPLAIAFPIKVQQIIHVLFPEKHSIRNETVAIENPAFRYASTVDYSEASGSPQLTLDYRYESLSDVVEVAALSQYLADRKRAYDDLGYYLRPVAGPPAPAPASTLAPVPRIVMFLSLALGIGIAIRFVNRFDPQPVGGVADSPVGIRGWLLLPAFVVIVTPIISGAAFYAWARFLDFDRWYTLQDAAAGPFKPWVHVIALLFVFFGMLLLAGEAILVSLFFRKRSSAPKIFIVVCWAAVAMNAAVPLFLMAAQLGAKVNPATLVGGVVGGVVRGGIYTAYILLSKRVEATFVVRYRKIGMTDVVHKVQCGAGT